MPTPSSSSGLLPPAKRTKTSATTYKSLTADSPLLPVGLDISGYDFKVNEVNKKQKKKINEKDIYTSDIATYGSSGSYLL